MVGCRICGAPHVSCGPPSTVTPVDSHITEGGLTVGLNRYEVTVEGRHKTTLLLSDEDAKRMGVLKEKPARAPRKARGSVSNKARTPSNKAAAKPADRGGVEAASDPGASD